jgi:hypothetical protein
MYVIKGGSVVENVKSRFFFFIIVMAGSKLFKMLEYSNRSSKRIILVSIEVNNRVMVQT